MTFSPQIGGPATMNGGGGLIGPQVITPEVARQLLDFSQKLDMNLLDQVVETMYTAQGVQQRVAQEVLTNLKEHPDAWTRVDTILEYSKNQQTKYFALQILEQVIKTRWKILPRNQCDGIKKYIVGLIIKTSQNETTIDAEKVYLNKLNMVLVLILKKEWPRNWPTFISDIVGASKTNENLCRNNMIILKLLSEELFDFSSGTITQSKAKHLKESMCQEFANVYSLCQYVMTNSCNPLLVEVTLETLLRFLNWIPLGYIFETDLIETLISKFLHVNLFRNVTLKCLTEIGGVHTQPYSDKFEYLFRTTMLTMSQIIPADTDMRVAYAAGNDSEQKFIQNLALFLCTMLKNHSTLMEQKNNTTELLEALRLLTLISKVDDVEIFKICLEYWGFLCSELYRKDIVPDVTSHNMIMLNSPFSGSGDDIRHQRLKFYSRILTELRYIMIGRMAKPEEVLVVENEQGEVVREFLKDTDSMTLYKNMRECLVYLTHLDCQDTERIMTEKLRNQVNGVEWSWKNLNTLCWAIGSISGAMHEETEKRFLVTVIKDLLGLCEQKRGKDNKAIIASNIMYVVGQYPRFLRAHWKFLKTVVNKLFEFMHETHEGVQDMACDTFIKIAQKCKRHFVQVQVGEVLPFIEEILTNMSSIIYDLQPQQVHTFCEAVGYMIGAQTDQSTQERLIEKYMSLPNVVWDEIINQATKNVDILKDPDAVKQLGNILKTNYRACKSLGHPYVTQLGRIYLDMLNVYKVMSENICAAIQTHGEAVTKQPLIRSMRTVKKDILRLIGCWVSKSDEPKLVLENFIQPLLDAVLQDYLICPVPEAREPEVLYTMQMIVCRMEGLMTPFVPTIFDALFKCTLEMINKEFEEFPEHRINLYLLLQAIVKHNFVALLNLSSDKFKLVLDSIIWAFKHTMRNVADTGLDILLVLLTNIAKEEQAAQSFYQTYYTDIMQHLFSVVTDTSHTGGLVQQASILAYMFTLVDSGKIIAPLAPNVTNNVQYVQQFVANLLKCAFPHLTDNQIKITVEGFIHLDQNLQQFKEHLRDFLVQIREYCGEDDADLYLEEREKALKEAEEEKRKVHLSVPGIINPHELPEDMQD